MPFHSSRIRADVVSTAFLTGAWRRAFRLVGTEVNRKVGKATGLTDGNRRNRRRFTDLLRP
jgi:hypothetical protein